MKYIKKHFFLFWFKLFGWKITGANNIPKKQRFVIAVAPHTSNIDFFVGLAAKHIIFLKSHFLAKDSLFKIPVLSWFLKSIGGHSVDRSKNTNMVDQVVELYGKYDEFAIAVAPEGTRSYNPKWKTGFYHIAEKAKVPVLLVGFDYENKEVSFREPYFVSSDKDMEIEKMKAHFRTIKGRNPEKGVIE